MILPLITHSSLQAAFAERRFELPPRSSGCSLQAYADRLSSYYAIRARQAVLVGAEVQEWAAFDEYALAQLQADEYFARLVLRETPR